MPLPDANAALFSTAMDMRIDQFQFVDRVDALDIHGAVMRTAARIPDEHSIFQGHFPGHALMPGVLLTEFMAQTCGFLLLSLNGFSKMPFLAAIKEVKLRNFVVPGASLQCEARRIHNGSGYAVLTAEVRHGEDDKLICDGSLMFRIVLFPNAGLEAHMRDRAGEVGLSLQTNEVSLLGEAQS